MVITLCGSTKFKDEFIEAQKQLTLSGHIVISVGLFGHSGDDEVWSDNTKQMLDTMHKQKIDMSDAIYIVHPEYIGSSTKSEIAYALANHKKVYNMVDGYDLSDFVECDEYIENSVAIDDKLFATPYLLSDVPVYEFNDYEVKMLQSLADKVYSLAVHNGKYDKKPAVSPLWMHVIDEILEANKAALTDRHTSELVFKQLCKTFEFDRFKFHVKDTFEDEMADLLLLICSIAGYFRVKIAQHAALKQQFNIHRSEHSTSNQY